MNPIEVIARALAARKAKPWDDLTESRRRSFENLAFEMVESLRLSEAINDQTTLAQIYDEAMLYKLERQ